VGGQPIPEFRTVTHRVPMLSIDNTYNAADLREWDARVRKALPGEKVRYVVEMKIDGVAVSLTYVDGALQVGATRGDGERGDDITTHNTPTRRRLPLKMNTHRPPHIFEARGEVYMPRGDFALLKEEARAGGRKPYETPPTPPAGSLKLLDPRQCAERRLRLF